MENNKNSEIDQSFFENKNILEIGPGTGNLTKYILNKKPKNFTVIEKDNDLINNLMGQFKEKLNIIHDDVLNINESLLFKEKVIVFGNLPYNISTEILSKWIINLKDNFWFENLVLMFQKEVADRIIANYNNSPGLWPIGVLDNEFMGC